MSDCVLTVTVQGLAPHMVHYTDDNSSVNTYTGVQIPLSRTFFGTLATVSCAIKKTNQNLTTESRLSNIYHNNKIRKLILKQSDG